MFRFFRQLRQRIFSGNLAEQGRKANTPRKKTSPAGRYLLYALGEILLVVVGILIALQVDNWNEDRKKQQQAAEFRAQLREGVKTDMENIRTRVEFFEEAIRYGYQAEAELSSRDAEDTESQWQFVVQTFHASQIWNFNQVTATYNEVQNPEMTGYLGSAKLLNALQRYYNEWPLQLSVLTGGTQAYRDFIRSVIPMSLQEYMWGACYDIDVLDVQSFLPCPAPPGNKEAIERAYDEITGDTAFSRLLTRRLSTLYTRNVVYQNILLEAEALLQLLEAESL
jgi:siroheme synthase (precorrin-2 oxidase/ferrochelatase)